MEYQSIFDFLKEDKRFNDVYERCIDVEKSIIQQSSTAPFILGRSVSQALIKIIVKDNPKLSKRFFKKKKDGSNEYASLNDMIFACKKEKLISNRIFKKYNKIKKWGNSTTHVDENVNFLNEYKKEHRMLFDISLDCFKRFNIDDVNYEYLLDNYDYKIETYEDERQKQVNAVHFNDVEHEDLIESFESKTIFIPSHFFNSIVESYESNILDVDKFKMELKDYEYVDEENISLILDYFEDSSRNDVKKAIYNLHENLSNDVLKTLSNLNKTELKFIELNKFIDETTDSHQKEIYMYIKSLAQDLAKNNAEEYKKDLESSPITQFAENGRKLLNYKNYRIIEDDFGFSLEEFGENIFLDDDQTEAVEYDGKKPLVIDAGPGSGKTRVIIERVVHLVESGKKPDSILVITFTRKATQELRERLINQTDLDIKDINQIRISTVHGFCRYLIAKYEPLPYNYLSRHGERSLFFKKYKIKLGFSKYSFLYDHWIPKVLDTYDTYFSFKVDTPRLVKSIEDKMSPFQKGKNKQYKMFINNYYDDHEETDCPDWSNLELRGYSGPSYYYRWLNVAKSYPNFLNLMEECSTCDDNTVLVKADKILENEYILNQIQYKNILIDEFQDSDHNQLNIFKKLLKIRDTFTIVGDIDQSIYGWRGAYPEFFKEFAQKDVKRVTLHTNYRSSRNIVEFNEELIKGDRKLDKSLKSKKKYKAPIYQLANNNSGNEANRISSLIESLMNDKKIKYYSDVAVLFRTNKSLEKLIKELDSKGIDYYLKENNDFIKQTEVQAMLILFWYIMPYDPLILPNLGDKFLNLKGLGSDNYNEIFRLSDKTRKILKNIQENYEFKLTKRAKSLYSFKKALRNFEYAEVFEIEDAIKKEVFNSVKSFDIGLLDKNGLIELGIDDENDLNFFLKLNNLKNRMFNEKNSLNRLTTLKIFYELLNLTDYFSEISLDNNPQDLKAKDNLSLFSSIINDYESIIGDTDYVGLFTYLSRVLTQYSCRQSEADEGFNKVHLLSIHSAKGLEYPIVIVGSIKQGICPLNYDDDKGLYGTEDIYLEYKDNDPDVEKNKYLDEELRIIYVAATRAKEILILSTIGEDPSDVPDFLSRLKLNSKVNIELLEPYQLTFVPKIESSKVFKIKNDFPKVRFEDLVDDFLYCDFRYDLANNTRFKVKLRNDKYVNMVLHKLINSVHEASILSLNEVEEKINAIIEYHNISSSNIAFNIIKNVREYWRHWGNGYEVFENNINIFTQLQYCDLTSSIDLVIKENGKLSIVQFIGSDRNIPDIEMYKVFLLYYVYILKEYGKFKEYEFDKVYLHSLENNQRHEIDYDEDTINEVLIFINQFTKQIHDNQYDRNGDCSKCEYYGDVCTGN